MYWQISQFKFILIYKLLIQFDSDIDSILINLEICVFLDTVINTEKNWKCTVIYIYLCIMLQLSVIIVANIKNIDTDFTIQFDSQALDSVWFQSQFDSID